MDPIPVAFTRLTFDEEFNSFSNSPDGSAGTWMTAYPYSGEAARTLSGNSEAEYYSDPSVGENPFSLADGVLSIAATPAAPGSNPYGLPYDSGVITTDTSFSQTYGYFEVNAQLPSEQGLWPAFWMLPASNAYTAELDVFEAVDDHPTTIYSTVHGTTDGIWGSDFQGFSVPDMTSGLHSYGVDWEPATTTFYVDGVETGSAPTPSSMNDPMFLLLNLAVGGPGSWPGAPDAGTTFPASMQINWVHAYATAGTIYVGGRAAVPSATPLPVVTIGNGASVLALAISEDAWIGDAQFTVSVDGVQIGGIQTTTASHADGATQIFDVRGDFAPGPHGVSIDFINDAWGGSAQTDRNLYVAGATLDGAAVPGAGLALMKGGSQGFGFTVPAPAALPSIGSGPSVLALTLSEDAWNGDAQFTVSIDGTQIGGVQTATASHAAGATQVLDVLGDFAPGPHNVSIDFLNDAWGGSAATDRNLYVAGATLDGEAVPGATLALMKGGSQGFGFVAPATPSATAGAGADSIVMAVAEDAWRGNARFTVNVDGTQVGGTMTATASHQAGASQTVTLRGNWGTGAHVIGITFLNDAYHGTPETDRNLYLDSLTYDGVAASPSTAAMMWNGTYQFDVPAAGGAADLQPASHPLALPPTHM